MPPEEIDDLDECDIQITNLRCDSTSVFGMIQDQSKVSLLSGRTPGKRRLSLEVESDVFPGTSSSDDIPSTTSEDTLIASQSETSTASHGPSNEYINIILPISLFGVDECPNVSSLAKQRTGVTSQYYKIMGDAKEDDPSEEDPSENDIEKYIKLAREFLTHPIILSKMESKLRSSSQDDREFVIALATELNYPELCKALKHGQHDKKEKISTAATFDMLKVAFKGCFCTIAEIRNNDHQTR